MPCCLTCLVHCCLYYSFLCVVFSTNKRDDEDDDVGDDRRPKSFVHSTLQSSYFVSKHFNQAFCYLLYAFTFSNTFFHAISYYGNNVLFTEVTIASLLAKYILKQVNYSQVFIISILSPIQAYAEIFMQIV